MKWYDTLYKFVKGAVVGATGGLAIAATASAHIVSIAASGAVAGASTAAGSGLPMTKTVLIAAIVGGIGHALINAAEQRGGTSIKNIEAGGARLAPVVVQLLPEHARAIAAQVAAAIQAAPGA